MGLLQEWYIQEAIDNEEEKFHRPLSDEQLFFMLSVREILTLYAKTVSKRNLPRPKGLESSPVTR